MKKNVSNNINRIKPAKQDFQLMEQAYAIVMRSVAETNSQRRFFEETRLVNLIETSDSPLVMIEPEELTIKHAAREKCMVDFFFICRGGNSTAKDEENFWKNMGFEPLPEFKQEVLEDFNQEYSRLANVVRNIIKRK